MFRRNQALIGGGALDHDIGPAPRMRSRPAHHKAHPVDHGPTAGVDQDRRCFLIASSTSPIILWVARRAGHVQSGTMSERGCKSSGEERETHAERIPLRRRPVQPRNVVIVDAHMEGIGKTRHLSCRYFRGPTMTSNLVLELEVRGFAERKSFAAPAGQATTFFVRHTSRRDTASINSAHCSHGTSSSPPVLQLAHPQPEARQGLEPVGAGAEQMDSLSRGAAPVEFGVPRREARAAAHNIRHPSNAAAKSARSKSADAHHPPPIPPPSDRIRAAISRRATSITVSESCAAIGCVSAWGLMVYGDTVNSTSPRCGERSESARGVYSAVRRQAPPRPAGAVQSRRRPSHDPPPASGGRGSIDPTNPPLLHGFFVSATKGARAATAAGSTADTSRCGVCRRPCLARILMLAAARPS